MATELGTVMAVVGTLTLALNVLAWMNSRRVRHALIVASLAGYCLFAALGIVFARALVA